MSGDTITLHMIQGGLLTLKPADVFGVAKSGSGSVVGFWNRPEGADPWQSVAHVTETPEAIKAALRKAYALDKKLREWKR
jgi:hypothetical protein